MAEIEIEHPKGQRNLTRQQKHDAKVQSLRWAFGDKKYKELLKEAKEFFTLHKKEVLRNISINNKNNKKLH